MLQVANFYLCYSMVQYHVYDPVLYPVYSITSRKFMFIFLYICAVAKYYKVENWGTFNCKALIEFFNYMLHK